MKTKEQILSMFFAKLAEYQHLQKRYENCPVGMIDCNDFCLMESLETELRLLTDILGEDIPEEYWEQIENI